MARLKVVIILGRMKMRRIEKIGSRIVGKES